jgi:hypothetical protein
VERLVHGLRRTSTGSFVVVGADPVTGAPSAVRQVGTDAIASSDHRRPEVTSRQRPAVRRRAVLGILAAVLAVAVAVSTSMLGAGGLPGIVLAVERFLSGGPSVPVAGPSPGSYPTPATPATPAPTALPTAAPVPSRGPVASPSPPSPCPAPAPVRLPVQVTIVADPAARFASQATKDWCAPAGVQMVLAALDLADTSVAFQRTLAGRIGEWTTREDSRNGGWGPSAMIDALHAHGATGYELRAYATRDEAMRSAASALMQTGSPVLLLAWRGAHAWVMTGFRADADPTLFPDAVVSGAYILDPWYPRISTLWGPSDQPGAFQDEAEMIRNYLPWRRPEGRYPERDGLFLAIVPTVPVRPVLAGE